jgi:hypothetical protein
MVETGDMKFLPFKMPWGEVTLHKFDGDYMLG